MKHIFCSIFIHILKIYKKSCFEFLVVQCLSIKLTNEDKFRDFQVKI